MHDFGGFPPELYALEYAAPGDPELAEHVAELLRPAATTLDDRSWGLDHGTWSGLCHALPEADIPVIQLSIDETQPSRFHYDLGRRLGSLRDEGVLVLGSGNLVHNLHTYSWGQSPTSPFDWAVRFETEARRLLQAHDHDPLVEYHQLGADAALSVPTLDHYLPLLYVIGGCRRDERISFPVEGVDRGSVSILTIRVG